ncbi:MAG: dienelactone hydrolase family protein [Halothece sp.]
MDTTLTPNVEERFVQIPSGSVNLKGNFNIPDNPRGIILFAHGSGSSRHSPRNRYVAEVLNEGRFATLLLDLLTIDEEDEDRYTGHLRFNIGFLAERVVTATEWVAQYLDWEHLKLGYFGASTGAAAALVAASRRQSAVNAIVSRGGRPDLAGDVLSEVQAPTLLIVGGNDQPVIGMNEEALAKLQVEKKLEIVPGATHLFEEPGALEEVANLAQNWFDRYLS